MFKGIVYKYTKLWESIVEIIYLRRDWYSYYFFRGAKPRGKNSNYCQSLRRYIISTILSNYKFGIIVLYPFSMPRFANCSIHATNACSPLKALRLWQAQMFIDLVQIFIVVNWRVPFYLSLNNCFQLSYFCFESGIWTSKLTNFQNVNIPGWNKVMMQSIFDRWHCFSRGILPSFVFNSDMHRN